MAGSVKPGRSPSALDRACVVIPTYNEAANIAQLLRALRGLSGSMRLIVVDDGSPDQTAQAVRSLEGELGNLSVIERSGKSGRGSAVWAGFAAALQNPETLFFVEMDADFSHDPAELPQTLDVLARAEGESAIVARSRCHPESRFVDWPRSRIFFHKLANRFCKTMLGLSISDYTNGYRAYPRRAVSALRPGEIEARGYNVLIETAWKLEKKGFRFVNLPTLFVNRKRGRSNMGLREIRGSLATALKLRAGLIR